MPLYGTGDRPLVGNHYKEHEMEKQPVVSSIGIEGNKDTVIRIRLPDGRMIYASTNMVSFALLAAAGVRVVNVR